MLQDNLNELTYPFLDSIAIISIIVPEEYREGYTERVYINRKRKYADIRLHLNYKDFVFCSEPKRIKLFVEHLLTSLDTLKKKMRTDEEVMAMNEIIDITKSTCNKYMLDKSVQ